MFRAALLIAVLAAAAPVAAQRPAPPSSLPDASSSDEIIVTALRIPRDKLPAGVYWDTQSLLDSRVARENAQAFMKCALKSSDTALVRRVVDGEPNSATARYAQGWIKATHRSCYPPPPVTSNIVDGGGSILERGVIVEMALKSYAPDAALTREIIADGTVQTRFRERENYRNRLRVAQDYGALAFSSCLVKRQPVLSTRLFRSEPGSLLERGLIQAMIIGGRECLGGASRVTIDPSLMRVYIIDSFYRWVVAARGTESLIPAGA